MAGGSYTKMPMPEEPTRAVIPARATRQLPMLKEDDDEQATHLLPELHKDKAVRERPQEEPLHVRAGLAPVHDVQTGLVVSEFKFKQNPLARHHFWIVPFTISMVVVIVGAFVMISAGIFQRSGNPHLVTFPGGQSFPIQVGGSIDNVNAWLNTNAPLPPKKPLPVNPGPYSVLGKPTITPDFINRVLASYNSPAAGKGQALYDLGVKYGIDPVYALAFFLHESTMGTAGVARTTLSLGNLRCIPARSCVWTGVNGYFAQMNSWEDGFEQFYKLIRNLYVAKWGLVTVDQIIPVYAPSSDHNDVKGYIAALKHYVDTWHAGIIQP